MLIEDASVNMHIAYLGMPTLLEVLLSDESAHSAAYQAFQAICQQSACTMMFM